MVPLFAGVIIAGLGIGALLSAFAARHVPTPTKSLSPLVVMQTPTPIASVAQATATPQRSSAPSATRAATATPASTPTSKPTSSATATATSKPTATPARTQTPRASPTPTAVPTVSKTAMPAPTSTPTRAPVPVVAPSAAAVAVQSSPAEALVRKFLEAVAHGDDTTAYGTLGGAATPLGESQFLDPTMRITSMTTSRASGGGTNVQVEFRTARGEYFGTFIVDGSGSRITQREVIPVGGTTAR